MPFTVSRYGKILNRTTVISYSLLPIPYSLIIVISYSLFPIPYSLFPDNCNPQIRNLIRCRGTMPEKLQGSFSSTRSLCIRNVRRQNYPLITATGNSRVLTFTKSSSFAITVSMSLYAPDASCMSL